MDAIPEPSQASTVEVLPTGDRTVGVTRYAVLLVPLTKEDKVHIGNMMEAKALPWMSHICEATKTKDGRDAVRIGIELRTNGSIRRNPDSGEGVRALKKEERK